jgi:hypothetical protein
MYSESSNGTSWRERSLIVSLKRFLFEVMWRVLHSNGNQTELKSPVKSQGSWIWSFRFFSSWKKLGLSSSELGPYTLVIHKMESLVWDSNFDEIENGLIMEERSFRLVEFHEVRIPCEAFVASTVMKIWRALVRKVADLNWLTRDIFVSWSNTMSKELDNSVSLMISHSS